MQISSSPPEGTAEGEEDVDIAAAMVKKKRRRGEGTCADEFDCYAAPTRSTVNGIKTI